MRIAGPAAPEVDPLADVALDEAVVVPVALLYPLLCVLVVAPLEMQTLHIGPGLADEPVVIHDALRLDLHHHARLDLVQVVERPVRLAGGPVMGVARYGCDIVAVDDHRVALPRPGREVAIPNRAGCQVAGPIARADRPIDDLEELDGQARRVRRDRATRSGCTAGRRDDH